MISIPIAETLKPYFHIAEGVAKHSPCERRQYGALISHVGPDLYYIARTNERVSNCCNGYCIRTQLGLSTNGKHENVEVGAEVHAETAALIDYTAREDEKRVFILVGFAGAQELLSEAVYPCGMCAKNIKYAGFKHIYIKNRAKEIVPVSIDEIIRYRERELLSDEHDA